MSFTAAAKDIMKESNNKKMGKSHSGYSQLIGIEELKGNMDNAGSDEEICEHQTATK